ncbi:hypothetical protein CH367_10835 [Leptospira barantonii]|uniref:Uncharacterized protein n=1 Tax=Leptospira barantonii TaxID=2023184 RepID=A0ABX4NK80_9LEPT|nr:hypothetical protein CH367_10835 [Leptospira barantonii]
MNRNHVSDNRTIPLFEIETLCSFEFLDSPVRKKNGSKIELRQTPTWESKERNLEFRNYKMEGRIF